MIRVERGLLYVLIAAALVAGAHAMFCLQEPVPNRAGAGIGFVLMDDVGEELQAGLDRTRECGLAKRAVVAELLAEHLTLRQAAARFQELNATTPERQLVRWREACPGQTDEERCCWTVLRYVGAELLDQPQQARAVRQRLEGELPERLRRRLPHDLRFGGRE
jgi:hypothetical protein